MRVRLWAAVTAALAMAAYVLAIPVPDLLIPEPSGRDEPLIISIATYESRTGVGEAVGASLRAGGDPSAEAGRPDSDLAGAR
jgi:hypothetical protein